MSKKCEEILKELESENKLKVWWDFEFPEKQELKLRLKDILEQKVDEKYYLKDYQIENILKSNFIQERKRIQGKDYCDTLCARDWKDPKCVEVNSPIRLGNIYGENKGASFAGNVWDKEAISPTLTSMQGGNRQPMIVDKINYQGKDVELPCIGASRGRNPDNPSDRTVGAHTEQRLEINTNGTSNTITSVQKDNYVVESKEPRMYNPYNKKELKDIAPTQTTACGCLTSSATVLITDNDKINSTCSSEKIVMNSDNDENNSIRTIGYYSPSKHEASRVVDSNGLSPTVKENHGTVTATNINTRIRKLTPKECWRLMGFTDDDFCKAERVNSNTQLYKQAVNSIVVDVLEQIFKNLLNNYKERTEENTMCNLILGDCIKHLKNNT